VWRRTEFPPNRGVRDDRSQEDEQKRCLTACGSLKRKKPQPGQIAYAIVSMEWLA